MKRNLVIGVILLIGVTILLVGGGGNITNQRIDPQLAINEQNMDFQSRLKDMPTDNLETLTEPVTELQTSQVQAATDGNSEQVQPGDSITVNYKGWLASDGTIFDQSFNRGDEGFTFTVGQGVIQGWSEGVVGMRAGEIRRLKIPYEKAYGAEGRPPTIPEEADLIFDVELISIN